jgi:hypothetical protein
VIPSADGSTTAVSSVSGAAPGASRIVLSPDGSAAALWFSSTGHIQVIYGLPGSAAVRDIDASFLGADPAALAVSDDGQGVAGAWTQGLYAFGPASQVTVLPVDAPVTALSFFHRRADLALATATQGITIADIGGSAVPAAVWSNPVDQAPPGAAAGSLLGIGVSFDNNNVVTAWDSGGLITINLATGTSASTNCGCAPAGIFGLGGSVFRLTGLNSGALKVFDSATGDVWFVPLAASKHGRRSAMTTRRALVLTALLLASALSAWSQTLSPASLQPSIITINQAYGPVVITATPAPDGSCSWQFSQPTPSLRSKVAALSEGSISSEWQARQRGSFSGCSFRMRPMRCATSLARTARARACWSCTAQVLYSF